MKQISGNKLLVKALKEEGVEYTSSATREPAPSTSAMKLYKQNDVKSILPRHEQALVHEADAIRKNNRQSRRMPCNQRSGSNQPCNRPANRQL